MDRLTLDMEGARAGEISAASLQMGDDTIAIQRIATMSIDAHEFAPWDTPKNRATKDLYATGFIGCLFFGLGAMVWFVLRQYAADAFPVMLIGAVLIMIGLVLGLRASMVAMKLRKTQPYYRLTIGTSDGRQIPLVDNSRETLTKLRDLIRHKMDSNDTNLTASFDLNEDRVSLNSPATEVDDPLPSMFTRTTPADGETDTSADRLAEKMAAADDRKDPDILFEEETAATG